MHAHSLTLATAVLPQTRSSQTWQSLSAVSAGGRYDHTPLSCTLHVMVRLLHMQNTRTILAANSQGHIKVNLCMSYHVGWPAHEHLLLSTAGAGNDLLD